MILRISHQQTDYAEQVEVLRRRVHSGALVSSAEEGSVDVRLVVADILAAVRAGGDEEAAALTRRLDRASVTPDALAVPREELAAAHSEAEAPFLALIRRVVENIRQYQSYIQHRTPEPMVRDGVRLGVRYTPVDRVGVYVPGGRALYPSSVLMSAVPAQVAGVREIVVVSPPTGGDIDPMVKTLAHELGVHEVYRLGGAVAVAALAYGTERIRPVDMIVGPGNAFVTEAKRQVLGTVGIDGLAGPSEVVIVADGSAEPAWVAADMIAQVEHDPGSAVLLTSSAELADRVAACLAEQVPRLSRADAVAIGLAQNSAIVVAPDLDAACELSNRFAPEHLHVHTEKSRDQVPALRHAGAIFIGPHTPVPMGDYVAGPSHTLPTSGTCRFDSPLSVNTFLKATSTIEYDADSLAREGQDAIDFAHREGLTAHASAVKIRQGSR